MMSAVAGVSAMNPVSGYQMLPPDAEPAAWAGKKVFFTGFFSEIPAQHMIASTAQIPHRQSFYIDPAPEYRFLNQMVGYYNGGVALNESLLLKSRIRFYGEFVLIKGQSKKGDGSSWSEWGFIIKHAEKLQD